KRFEDTIYGIIGAESPVVMQIAAHSPHRRENAFHTAKGIYRFLDAPEYEEQNLLLPIYEKAKKDLGHENEVVVVIDLSPWEKPYAKKMERLCKVEKKDKSGLTNGYVSVSTICIGEDIKRLGYFHLFANEPLSQNLEIRKAMEETNKLLPSGAKVIWVWDKGFDDGKNYEDIIGGDKEFIGRVYHNRKITVKGSKTKLLDWGRTLPVKTRFKASIFIWGKRREIEVEISFGRCKWNTHQVYLLRSRIVKAEGINLEKIKEEDRGWWLLTNICIKDEKSAFKVWRTYYKRWAIEDFFKFVKDGLMEEVSRARR
ncbi:MAG: hypothetical protein QME40_08090, partial [bacterium]|nr:hypothetical protein [bacterium]